MKQIVVGWDRNEQQAFWDVIPVGEPLSLEDGEERARERFICLRGDYADIVDVLTPERLLEMAARIIDCDEDEDERAYRALEEGDPSDERGAR